MATWKVKPKTEGNSLAGAISYDNNESNWQVYQDEKPFVDMIKQERETHSSMHTHMKKFATIPDIVAMELLTKHGLDIHDPTFMHDVDKKKKLRQLLISEFPHLVVST